MADRVGGWVEKRYTGEGNSEVQSFSYKINESGYEIHSVGNIVNNYVVYLYSDRW